MQRILQLLNQKNHYLEKFYSLNETELLNFARGDFNTLDSFYQMRDKILEIIKYIDEEIDREHVESKQAMTTEDRIEIREALAIKEEYVRRILSQDLEVLACIEVEKSKIIRELQSIQKSKSAVGKYKSGMTESRRLDEEI